MQKAKKRKPARRHNMADMLVGLTAWLTTRPRPIIFSAKHDAAPAAEIVGKFIAANNLGPSKNPKVKIPPDTDHITSEPQNTKSVAAEPLTPQQAVINMTAALFGMSKSDQDLAIGALVRNFKNKRLDYANYLQKMKEDVERDLATAKQDASDLDRITRGDFVILNSGQS